MQNNTDGRSMWNGLASNYDDLYQSKWCRHEDDEVASWLVDAMRTRPPRRALDIGCGTGLGYTVVRKLSHDCEYVGVDISDKMIEKFKQKLALHSGDTKASLHVADAKSLSELFPVNQFDLVMFLNASASYIGGATAILRDSSRVLQTGGTLFVSFLNRDSLRRCLHGHRGISELYGTRGAICDGVPVLLPTGEELTRRCNRIGLQMQWIKYQSVLGGVAEHSFFMPLELASRELLPKKGHTVNLLATKLN
jgi:ubiquinone/menaquinone biosynthesis C-methylase UbiE